MFSLLCMLSFHFPWYYRVFLLFFVIVVVVGGGVPFFLLFIIYIFYNYSSKRETNISIEKYSSETL